MFTVLLGKPNRLFHQIRSQDSTLISVLLKCSFDCLIDIPFFFIARDIQSDYHRHFTRWLISVSCALNVVALKCWENCRTYIHSLLNWTPAFAHLRTHSLKFVMFFFLIVVFLSYFKTKKIEKFTYISKRFGTLFRLWWGQCYPTRTQVRALLSRSSREMKFDSSSWYVKAGLLRFWDNVRVFLQTAHFVKSRAHSPRPTSRIIAMIALRSAILMKVDHVVSLHAHRLFSGRACLCKKDPCSQPSKDIKKSDREIRVRSTL